MKKIFFFLFFTASLNLSPLLSVDSLFSTKSEPKIVVNNRILTKVENKPITTYDLMKKMDIAFYKRYPEFASSTEARYEFYSIAWRHFLEEILNDHLILADANLIKMKVTSGDIRQEMESSFGPNIIANLDKIGMNFEEAAKLIEKDMIIDRMISGRVHAKALRQVTPSKIREAYEEHIKDPANTKSTEWTYRSITIKERNLKQTEEVAKIAHHLLSEGTSLENLPEEIQKERPLSKTGKITLSTAIKANEQELSPLYKEHLSQLDTGEFTLPFSQKSRATGGTVYRILWVDEKVPGGVPAYNDLEASLKSKLLNDAFEKESVLYFQKLQNYYHLTPKAIEDSLPKNYTPFSLKT